MQVIYKYGPLEVGHVRRLSMPVDAEVVHLQDQGPTQHGVSLRPIFLWARVGPSNDLDSLVMEDRTFLLAATGQRVDDRWRCIGSLQLDGYYMYHLFEEVG